MAEHKRNSIPNSVTVIDEGTFSNCKSLVSITIPYSITTICNSAFSNCKKLKMVQIKGYAQTIDWNSFSNVNVTAYYPANNETRTEAVRQNYGGNISWIVQKVEELPDIFGEATTNAVKALFTYHKLAEAFFIQ